MVQPLRFSLPRLQRFRVRALFPGRRKSPRFVLALIFASIGAVSMRAQTASQQHVYVSVPLTTSASEVTGFSKGPAGALASLPGAPFTDPNFQAGPMAIDGQGQFLFVIDRNSSNIWMFQIDQGTGALTVAPLSPFAVGATENPTMAPSLPVCLATERSGQFLYVGYNSGNFQGYGAVIEYLIDATHLQLVPVTGQESSDIPAAPSAMLTNARGSHLYVGLTSSAASYGATLGTNVYAIDPSTGFFTPAGSAGNVTVSERSIAIDPRGRFFFDGWGADDGAGYVESAPILADGTAVPASQSVSLGPDNFPSAMLVDSTGGFLYVSVPNVSGAFVFSIDATTGALGQPQGPLTALSFQSGSAVADPLGPYIYSLQNGGVHAFQVDPLLGSLSEILGSPFSVGGAGGVGGLAISGMPVQAVSGPAAELSPPSVNFGDITVGQSSSGKIIRVSNIGNESLALNSLTVSGSDATEFIASPNCPPVLQANATCSVTVTFTPKAAGLRQASFAAADNGPGSPQSITFIGTGVAPESAVTLAPGSVAFASIDQGTASSPKTVSVTNSGVATLHVSSVALSGANPNDFQLMNACSGAYLENAVCTIGVTFAPLAAGLRTASIVITDDAPDSPQSVQLRGTGTGAPVTKPAVSLSPATISFGTITQGITSGPQSVTLTNVGSAALHISSVTLNAADASDYKMINGCNPASYPIGASCTVSLTFLPLAAGAHIATLTISDEAPNSPQTISVNASVTPAVTLSPSATGGLTATVTAGQPATYNLLLVPGAGFAGTVSFTCSGVPAGAACNPFAPLKITNANALPFSITVTTTASSAVTPFSSMPRLPPVASWWVLLASLLWLILLTCSVQRLLHRAASGRLIGSAAFAALALLAFFHAGGCGGGSTAAQSTPVTQPIAAVTGTPQGTFTITLAPMVTTESGVPLAAPLPIPLTLIVK
jgi:Abnormal spindle-like microcephaly-assoc'd, ASPM-SPD-2-Hydin